MSAPSELLRANAELADLAANVATARERVALSLGPQQGDEAAYWQELAEWRDWSRWVGPPRVEGYGELAELPGWGERVRAMCRELDS